MLIYVDACARVHRKHLETFCELQEQDSTPLSSGNMCELISIYIFLHVHIDDRNIWDFTDKIARLCMQPTHTEYAYLCTYILRPRGLMYQGHTRCNLYNHVLLQMHLQDVCAKVPICLYITQTPTRMHARTYNGPNKCLCSMYLWKLLSTFVWYMYRS
jgi:hypothetical protein